MRSERKNQPASREEGKTGEITLLFSSAYRGEEGDSRSTRSSGLEQSSSCKKEKSEKENRCFSLPSLRARRGAKKKRALGEGKRKGLYKPRLPTISIRTICEGGEEDSLDCREGKEENQEVISLGGGVLHLASEQQRRSIRLQRNRHERSQAEGSTGQLEQTAFHSLAPAN